MDQKCYQILVCAHVIKCFEETEFPKIPFSSVEVVTTKWEKYNRYDHQTKSETMSLTKHLDS